MDFIRYSSSRNVVKILFRMCWRQSREEVKCDFEEGEDSVVSPITVVAVDVMVEMLRK